jgi:hypothetical protein
VSQQPRKVRRTPNFTAFLLTGGAAGLLAGLALGIFGPGDTRYDDVATLGFLGLVFAGAGLLVGGLAAVLLDRRTQP